MILDNLNMLECLQFERPYKELIKKLIRGQKFEEYGKDSSQPNLIYKIVSNEKNSLDVDKLDYICWDAHHTSVNGGDLTTFH